MLAGGVVVVNFTGEHAAMNNLCGDIVSLDGTDHYRVKLRGSDGKEIRAKQSHLIELLNDESSVHDQRRELERKRTALLEARSHNDAKHLELRVLALELFDQSSYLVISNTNPMGFDPLPERAAAEALVRYVAGYRVFNDVRHHAEGRDLTSFYMALSPFYKDLGEGRFSSFFTERRTSGDLFDDFRRIFSSSVDELGRRDEMVFFRAFSHAQHRMDSLSKPTSSHDSLVDVFCLLFYAIQLLQDKIPQMAAAQIGSASSIKTVFRTFGRIDLKRDDLLWCFCILFLKTAVVVRKELTERQYNLIFPVPFDSTITELARIAHLAIQLRPCPHSYLLVYEMMMDSKEFGVSDEESWMKAAYDTASTGLRVSDEVGDPFYQYTFHVIMASWLPTTAHAPTPYSFGEMKSRIRRAKEFKLACESYVYEPLFAYGTQYEQATRQVFKAFRAISDDVQQTAPLMNSYAYFSARFETRYYQPGGKFDSLSERYACANCSTQVAQRLRCSRCGKVTYCSKECQRTHWKAYHKEACVKKAKVKK